MTKRYYSVQGEILGDSVNGTYLRDALGSVTATIPNKVVANTYRYKPYGSQLAKTGSSPDPKFLWVGTAGYRQSSISHSATYVRARHCGQEEGRWTTVDPLWPAEKEYNFLDCSPATNQDLTGRSGDPCKGDGGTDRFKPPDCSKCKPKGKCRAVWLTCYKPGKGKDTAVYCDPDALCTDSKYIRSDGTRDESGIWSVNRGAVSCIDIWTPPKRGWIGGRPGGKPTGKLKKWERPCREMCPEYYKDLGVPPFSRGTPIYIGGVGNRVINDCGCGQQISRKPVPDSWIDTGNGCPPTWRNHWSCVCPR